ncbi:MAG: response regulator [Bacteroidetes bacterium]|nr:response regulator [Bacteroidota bacterium]
MDNEISILIVEDEGLIAHHIKTLLEGFGYSTAGTCYSYQKAAAAVSELAFDLLITDIDLGHGIDQQSGIQVASQVKQQKDCPVIFLTAYNDKDTIKKAAATLPSAFLVKPVNAANLFAAIQLAVNNFISKKGLPDDSEEAPDYFFVKQGNTMLKICWKDVVHMESIKNYVKIRSNGQPAPVLIRDSLKQVMQDMVPAQYKNDFLKISRSEMIAKKAILKVDKEFAETAFGKFKLGKEFDRKQLL